MLSLLRSDKSYIILITVLACLMALLCLNANYGNDGDNAEYLSLARSISSGDGYTRAHLQGNPSDRKYPVLYPTLLSIIMTIIPGSVIALKLPSIISFILLPLFSYLCLSSYGYLKESRLVLLFCLTSPLLFSFSNLIMTELLYIVLSLLTLTILKKAEGNGRSAKGYIIGGIAGLVILFYLRSIGIVLLVSTTICFIFNRRFKEALLILVCFILLISPWVYRNATMSTSLTFTEMEEINSNQLTEDWLSNLPYSYQFFEGEDLWEDKGLMFVKKMCSRIAVNSRFYFKSTARVILTSFFLTEGWEEETCFPFYAAKINNHFGIKKGNFSVFLAFLIAGITIMGYLKILAKRHDLISMYVLAYMGLLLIGPIRIMEDRYLVPLVPFIFLYFTIGLKYAIKLLCSCIHVHLCKINFDKLLLGSLAAVIILSNFALCATMAKYNIYHTLFNQNVKRYGLYPEFYRDLFTVAEWVNENTANDAVIMTVEAPLFYLYANRKVAYPSLDHGNVDYIIATSSFKNRYINEGMPNIDAYNLENKVQPIYKFGDIALFKLNNSPK